MGVMISASQRLRLDQVEQAIRAAQSKAYHEADLVVPDGFGQIISEMYDNLEVRDTQYQDGVTVMTVHGPAEIIATFRHKLEKGAREVHETIRRKS